MGNNTYEEIEYPLKDISSLIESSSKECTNFNQIDPNIEIIYNTKSDIPSIYRCPICLIIPFLYYNKPENKPKIYYLCNCGFHNCCFNYFFQNFVSIPIDRIIYKDIKDENAKIKFCKQCSKFMSEDSNHDRKYYGHSCKEIDNIFLTSKNGNFTEFYGGITYAHNCNKLDSNKYDPKIEFKSFISSYLNFNIIKKLENRYKEYQKIISVVKNEEFKLENYKLYLFAKFLYYVFQKNLSENTLNLQIMLNLYIIIKQLNTDSCYYPLYYYYFNNFHCLNKNAYKDKYSLLKQFQYLENRITLDIRIDKILYDTYSHRYIIQAFNNFLISQKESITDIFLYKENISYKFLTVLYLKNLNKNVVVFQNEYFIEIIDIEDGKYIDFDFMEREKIRNIKLLDNKYLIIHINNKIEFFNFSQKESNNLIKLEINKIFTYFPYDEEVFEIQNMIVLNKIDKLIFTKINKEENDLYEIFFLNIKKTKRVKTIDVIDIKKNRILIKYFERIDFNKANLVFKFEIYNLKTRQLILVFKKMKEVEDILFFGGKYIIALINYYCIIYDLNNLIKKGICSIHIPPFSKDWAIYPNNSGEWFLISEKSRCKIIYNNQIEKSETISFIFPSYY